MAQHQPLHYSRFYAPQPSAFTCRTRHRGQFEQFFWKNASQQLYVFSPKHPSKWTQDWDDGLIPSEDGATSLIKPFRPVHIHTYLIDDAFAYSGFFFYLFSTCCDLDYLSVPLAKTVRRAGRKGRPAHLLGPRAQTFLLIPQKTFYVFENMLDSSNHTFHLLFRNQISVGPGLRWQAHTQWGRSD